MDICRHTPADPAPTAVAVGGEGATDLIRHILLKNKKEEKNKVPTPVNQTHTNIIKKEAPTPVNQTHTLYFYLKTKQNKTKQNKTKQEKNNKAPHPPQSLRREGAPAPAAVAVGGGRVEEVIEVGGQVVVRKEGRLCFFGWWWL